MDKMSQSKADNLGKNAGSFSSFDIGFHYRAKDETIEELLLSEPVKEKKNDENVDSNALKEMDPAISVDSGSEKKSDTSSRSQSSSPSPSDYKKVFRNLNEFTEKLTRSVEGKISEIKDLSSSRSRLASSKDNSSLSDSEENSEVSGLKGSVEESPNKSLSLDLSVSESEIELQNEIRHRKHFWPSELTAFESDSAGRRMTRKGIAFEDLVEVEPAVEAQELTNPEDTDHEGEYFDAKDELPNEGDGDKTPKEGDVRKFVRYVTSSENQKIDGIIVFFTMCIFFLPLPSFAKGFMCCIVLGIIYYLLTDYWKNHMESLLPKEPFKIPDYAGLSPLKVPPTPTDEGVWFNEYTQPYDVDWFSLSHTVPVYMELEDSLLKLSRPKGKINKRATFDERKYKLEFVHQRVYDLRLCNIMLRPDPILRKRFFSKKYPIYIELGEKSLIKCVRFKENNSEEETIPVELTYKNIPANICPVSPKINLVYGIDYLNLFARCHRQKEEWFRKLLAASRFNPKKDKDDDAEPSTPFEKVFFDPMTAECDEYWQYMTKFIDEIRYVKPIVKTDSRRKSNVIRKRTKDAPALSSNLKGRKKTLAEQRNETCLELSAKESAIKSALEIQWFNALMNRFLFDVYRTPYWLNKIQCKLQKKLSTIRLPYYIEALEIVEMDLGKMGPKFHRISAPVLDDRGLWIDMDMTFDGAVKVILQTKLNLVKLQRGLEEEVSKLPDGTELRTTKEEKKTDVGTSSNAVDKIPDQSRTGQEKATVLSKIVPFPSSVIKKEVSLKDSKKKKLKRREISRRELMLEFAEIVVADKSKPKKEKSNVERPRLADEDDSDYSDSSESEEEDDKDRREEDEEELHGESPSKSSVATAPSSVAKEEESKNTAEEEAPSEVRKPLRKSSKRIFRMMETVAQSKYFKSIAETKYVQKAIAGVSATKLRLLLEVTSCIGTLTINVPPPPNDRIWYGFRTVPKIWMSAQPKFGDRNIRFAHIKHFVERKIMEEVKKVIVLPNMDDLLYPLPPDTDHLGKFGIKRVKTS